MSNNNNQFFDFAKFFVDPENMINSLKNIPAMDFSSFTNAVKNNAETLTTINQLAAESIQTFVRRSSEVFQRNASEMFNALRETTQAGNIEQAASRQQQYIKSNFKNSLENTKELMDIASKSAMEIFEVVGNSMTDNLNKTFDKAKEKV